MSYIFIEKKACEKIVQDRFFQNLGFSPARNLISLFKREDVNLTQLNVYKNSRGVVLTSGDFDLDSDALIFDTEMLSFVNDCSDSDLLVVIQKTLRFCVKYWGAMNFSSGEMIPKGSTKALVFPFPYVANRHGYRVTIEREPNSKRLAKRTTGKYLLAYKSGVSVGDGADEEASLTNFRKAYDDYQSLCNSISASYGVEKNSTQTASTLGITTLNATNLTATAIQGFERWMSLLTDDQKVFLNSDWTVPHRLEGPAGTGKTLCLVLKAVSTLMDSESRNLKHRSIFIAPSEEVVEIIKDRLVGNGGSKYLDDISDDYSDKEQSISIVTLQRLCSKLLNYKIDEAEYLDRDSVESKNTQLLYLDQIIEEMKRNELSELKGNLSPDLYSFLVNENTWSIAQLLQHEISVVIKGRANGAFDSYKTIPSLDYGLPIKTNADKQYIFLKHQCYQEKLEAANQYDIDDIVISAIGQLDTPIWRRRRQQMGYDSIFIDEVHLFNLNEASTLHLLTKSATSVPISYSIDRSQAVGDIGWNDAEFHQAIGSVASIPDDATSKISAVFRSSSDIVELAFCVTASGAKLFTNFENPLEAATNTFTSDEEKKCSKPCFTYVNIDSELPNAIYRRVDKMSKSLDCGKDKILIVVFDDALLKYIKDEWNSAKKPFKALERRGDFSTLTEASKAGCLVVSSPELVGGLEFQGVILVGCDKGRLPPINTESEYSRPYLNYRAHNNLYVAITRAKYRLELVVNRVKGISDILRRSVENNLLEELIDAS